MTAGVFGIFCKRECITLRKSDSRSLQFLEEENSDSRGKSSLERRRISALLSTVPNPPEGKNGIKKKRNFFFKRKSKRSTLEH
ncbi:hypothetical protein CEXT_238931 [Caerostris extrusa]|uniref:Uncharacterized protein n=1 Tax=Caerostris extrusa TaxID=172846 RepID=A0AAV4RBB4_CAEEX|nr:hypothetical protein CEXT_238931 [Caerostris extrusa]